ncbi:FecR family protein [Mariniflexile litorale]|uniref:FecR family protein n=1 Tax=Mariniflexile litorale TaxID=3045158 RepID=A0AAU7EDA6_9FLAO|nr:FecR family protein [Mariniflexile sp. KMM 9835]MDQ8211621.1 FecR family protein [Mariniflexile sp. KMM 9835]
MKKNLEYLEDKTFLDWIYETNPDSIVFWENYIKSNSKEKNSIMQLKAILKVVKSEESKLTRDEKQKIIEQVNFRIHNLKKPKSKYRILRSGLKYAALIVILLSTTLFYYFYNSTNNIKPFSNINSYALDSIAETKLIVAKGEEYLISEKESLIEYDEAGEVILNKKDTLNNTLASNNKIEKEVLNTLVVPYGKRSIVKLSDGSIVHLNAGTQFIFPEKFIGNKRVVYLLGEAFFEVEKNKDKPFIVKTVEDEFSIEVLGTKFNVSAYDTDASILTVLAEGSVNIVKDKLFGSEKIRMVPGELAAWNNKSKDVLLKKVNTHDYILWTKGVIQFESQSLIDVVKKVERFYNIKIEFDKTLNSNINITGKLFLTDSIHKTLKNIVTAASCKYEKKNSNTYKILQDI